MRPSLGVAALCLLAGAGAAGPEPPALSDFRVFRADADYRAACRLTNAMTPAILEEIEAGLETTVTYRFRIYRRRTGWLDEEVVDRRVSCTVRHDALAGQYTLTRRVDGELRDSRITDDAAAMREFLTVIDDLPLVRSTDLAADGEHYVKAKSTIGLMWRFYLIPWPLDTAWVRVPLTPVPEKAESHGARP